MIKEVYEKETGKKWFNSFHDGFIIYPSAEYAAWLEQKADEGERAIEAVNKIYNFVYNQGSYFPYDLEILGIIQEAKKENGMEPRDIENPQAEDDFRAQLTNQPYRDIEGNCILELDEQSKCPHFGQSSDKAEKKCVFRIDGLCWNEEAKRFERLADSALKIGNKTLEVKPMEEAIEKAVKLLAEKITSDVKSEDALRFTQAALNLEHVLAVKSQIKEQQK